jgi:hypothetical protein
VHPSQTKTSHLSFLFTFFLHYILTAGRSFSLNIIMTSRLFLLVLPALAMARFGQENAVQAQISPLDGTLGGKSINALLAGANACDQLTVADSIAALGGQAATDAAKAMVQAERNFNPFTTDRPTVCNDPTLPKTAALRGILPLIDPAVQGAAAVNAASKASLTKPVDATGKSEADLLTAAGFTTFTPQAPGQAVAAAAAKNNNANAGQVNARGGAAAGAAQGNAQAGNAQAGQQVTSQSICTSYTYANAMIE